MNRPVDRAVRHVPVMAAAIALVPAIGIGAAPGENGNPESRDLPNWSAPARGGNHIESLGERAGIWGSLDDGFESWVYPLKAFDSFSASVSQDGGRDYVPLADHAVRQVAAPHFAAVDFQNAPVWTIRSTFSAPRSKPGVIVHSDVATERSITLKFSFRASLAPMLMDGRRSLALTAGPDPGRYLSISDPDRGVSLFIGVDSPGRSEFKIGEDGITELLLEAPPPSGTKSARASSTSLIFSRPTHTPICTVTGRFTSSRLTSTTCGALATTLSSASNGRRSSRLCIGALARPILPMA